MTPSSAAIYAPWLIERLHVQHVGADNAAPADDLVAYLKGCWPVGPLQTDRDLRDVVRYCRLTLLEPVVSTYSGHYSWPTGYDDDAMDHCIKQRRLVAADNFAVAGALEKAMERAFPAEPVQLTLIEGAA